MGRIIQAKNGKTVIHTVGEEISLITAHPDTYVLGVDSISGIYEKLNPNGEVISLEGGTTAGGGITAVTYSDFVFIISNSNLSSGMLYTITDFQTCYDQPDFDYNNQPITSGNYKQGPIEPIIVLATSPNTISSNAYQPTYPNDKIQYDWTWDVTEATGTPAYGRITERIDEFNNRTDYDHRNIFFKRYRLFTTRADQPLNGTIELLSDGTVNGVDTLFTNLTVGDIICIPSTNPGFYEIESIDDDSTMNVIGDIIAAVGAGQTFYKAIEETNNLSDYFSFKRTNVKTDDFIEYTTFGSAISENYAKNNYVGNYANNYQNIGSGIFMLANNLFLKGQYDSNKFGDYCFNNTFGESNVNNFWGNYCYENVSTGLNSDNVIDFYFYRNLLNVNLYGNNIDSYFYENKLLAGNNENFEGNEIGNNFYNNIIYSYFYGNIIGSGFYNNTIGDFGNLTQFSFGQNQIGNEFYNNLISQDFNSSFIGKEFHDNTIFGSFSNNGIKFNFFNNKIAGDNFSLNTIESYFFNNVINDDFSQNFVKNNFQNNIISNNFIGNSVGNDFHNNQPSNLDIFSWYDLSSVLIRSYDVFYNALGSGNLGNRILGKELIMRVISTSQYFKFIFTQWSQNGSGGGFQYTRVEISPAGNEIGLPVTFTKVNYENNVDIIIPGTLELTRGKGGGAIYNAANESSFNQSISPDDTEWNSIYTEPNNGENFGYNKIGCDFATNTIGNNFGYDYGSRSNIIDDFFENNNIGNFTYNNTIGNNFNGNTIGDNFEKNTIKNFFIGNTIANNFEGNEIGDFFGQDGGVIQNIIFNDFKFNKIGNYFGNELNYPTLSGGTGADGGNVVNDGFQFNQIGDNCIYCMFDKNFDNNKIGNDFWINFFGANSNNNVIGNLFVSQMGVAGFPDAIGSDFVGNNIQNFAGFNQIGSGFKNNKIGNFFGNAGTSNLIEIDFTNNNIGNYFGDDGSHTNGGNITDKTFKNNIFMTSVANEDFTVNPTASVYQDYTCQIFERPDGSKRLLYFDNSDHLVITDINI